MHKVTITLAVVYDDTCENHPTYWDWESLVGSPAYIVVEDVTA